MNSRLHQTHFFAATTIVLALFGRLVLAYFSWGTSDATIWQGYGRHAARDGVLHLFEHEPNFNHPPLMGYFCQFVYRATHIGDQPDDPAARRLGITFPFVFKLFDIAADAVTCWLLWRMFRPSMTAAALFAWSPVSLLITGHHCNTDPIYSMLCLLSVYLIENRGRDFAGGIALAAAVNIKLIPALLILPMLARYREKRRAGRFVLGLSIGAIPFIVILCAAPGAFTRNVLSYGSMITNWGVNQFLLETSHEPRFSAVAQTLIARYYELGRYIILAAVILLSMRGRRLSIDRYTLAACAGCLFLIFTPGFGLQYTIFVLPLMLATGRWLIATIYGLLSGLLLFFTYWQMWTRNFPMDTHALIGPTTPGPLYGILAWATLIVFVFTQLRDPVSAGRVSTAIDQTV